MKKIIIFILIFTTCSLLKGQVEKDLAKDLTDTLKTKSMLMAAMSGGGTGIEPPNVIQPSPQSQIFDKYINHAITEYNGLPDITIPLYEIEIKGMKIPITLSYHASGIKFMQYDGEVGAGWSINAGGYRISRTIYGKSDLEYKFYNHYKFDSLERRNNKFYLDRYLGHISYLPGYSYIGPLIGSPDDYVDGQYDLFTYNTPSTSGSFIITERNPQKITSIEQNRDLISINKLTAQLTDENGFKYYFGGLNSNGTSCVEKRVYNNGANQYETAWALKKLVSPTKDEIVFDYKIYTCKTDRNPARSPIIQVSDASSGVFVSDKTGFSESQFSDSYSSHGDNIIEHFNEDMAYVDKIETPNEIIRFYRKTGYGNTNSVCLLDYILITDKQNKVVKKISFSYNLSPSNAKIDKSEPWHILLNSVKLGDNNKFEKEYNLEYYNPPTKYAFPDQWGYYIFKTSPLNFEPYWIHDEFKNDCYVRQYRYPQNDFPTESTSKYCQDKIGVLLGDTFFKRSIADTINFNSFSLKKINYPTGGYSEYEYEINQYYSPKYQKTIKGGGLRVSKIKSTPDNQTEALVSIFKYGFNEDGTGIANLDISDENFVDITFSARFATYKALGSLGGGLQSIVAAITNATKVYSGDIIGDASISLFNVHYPIVATYQYNEKNKTYNGKKISTYKIPEIYRTEIMNHPRNFIPLRIGHLNCVDINKRSQININEYNLSKKPIITTIVSFNNKNEIIQEEKFDYKQTERKVYRGIKSRQKITVSGDLTEKDYYFLPPNPYFAYNIITSFFDYLHYYIFIEPELLSSKTITLTTDNGKVNTTESYEYNDRNQVVKILQNSSRNGVLETEYQYPVEESELAKINILNAKLQEIVKQNGKEISRTKTIYPTNLSSKLPLPDYVMYSATGEAGLQSEFFFQYNQSNGNLLQYTGRDGIPVSFVWGYNYQYPIAKIVGATYSQVKTALGRSETSNDLAYLQNYSDALLNAEFTKLRNYFGSSSVQVFTYTYKPLTGILTETDPNGQTTFYNYDDFGRLIRVLDNNAKVLKQFEYHYKNQN